MYPPRPTGCRMRIQWPEWRRLVPILTANRLLTEAGTSALAMLCAVHGKIVQVYAAGESPSGHLLAQCRGLSNGFGLTPVAQGNVKAAAGGAEVANPFARNARRGPVGGDTKGC